MRLEDYTDEMKYAYWKGNQFERSPDGTYSADGLKWKEEEMREMYYSLNAERWRELPGQAIETAPPSSMPGGAGDHDIEFANWVERNYQLMNDGTYQDNTGKDVDEGAIRKHYEGHQELGELLRDDEVATRRHYEGQRELKELLREDSGRSR